MYVFLINGIQFPGHIIISLTNIDIKSLSILVTFFLYTELIKIEFDQLSVIPHQILTSTKKTDPTFLFYKKDPKPQHIQKTKNLNQLKKMYS